MLHNICLLRNDDIDIIFEAEEPYPDYPPPRGCDEDSAEGIEKRRNITDTLFARRRR